MNWKNIFDEGQELVISSCSNDGIPNINIVISLGFIDDKLLIADCQMDTTLRNLQETKKVCIFAKKNNNYLRLKGNVEIYNSGKYFDFCQKPDSEYQVKNAILINITEVFDLDKLNKIYSIESSSLI